MNVLRTFLFAVSFVVAAAAAASPYDVTWDSPSRDSSGSMPLGNGDIGVNVWVEQDGDLLFYISKTDAWSENARLIKLGRVRVKLSPNPFAAGQSFRQTLALDEGAVTIAAGDAKLRIWVDANHPVVRIDAERGEPFEMTAALEVWRTAERTIAGEELSSAYGMAEAPHSISEGADTILPATDGRIAWYHRNEHSIWRETMDLQGMGAWADTAEDPLLHRTFGGLISGDGLVSKGPATLHSKDPRSQYHVNVYCLCARTPTADAWRDQIQHLAEETNKLDRGDALSAHNDWWRAFWDRSWIRISGAEDAEAVSRGYALQRFVTACAGRGVHPIKFNGSIFTVDAREKGREFNADFRAWGGPYWFQNTRLPYWPMPASGDLEMMQPLFRMFADALPFAQARTRVYFGHDGAFFPETMYFWGAYANDNYGWKREGKAASFIDNTYIRWHWEGQLELLALMIEYHAYTLDDAFLRDSLLPMADSVLTFFDQHYTRDSDGKLLFKPAQALETWQQVVNPLPEIAGLRYVIGALLPLADEPRRDAWKKLLSAIPSVPVKDGMLTPAQEILAPASNSENPELYAIFPFPLYGFGKSELGLARKTYESRRIKGNNGWRQDDTQAALLGLTSEARRAVAERFANKHAGSRFPAFWGPNFDWIPDQDHGANGVMALQCMLMQTDGAKIYLLPAWPPEWDVDFKLHAPRRTTIEGSLRAGKITRLNVEPPERKADIQIPQ